MAGLISANMNKDNPLSSVAGYDPEKITLDENKDTVEGRVAGLINKNSALMQNAATKARQASNSKGLINSSMAIGDAQRAVYDVALPIASQDANTSFQTKALNQSAGNQALSQTADAQTRGSLQERAGQQAVDQIKEQGIISRQLAEFDRETRERLQQTQGQQSLEQIGAQGEVQSKLQAERAEIEKQLQTSDFAGRQELLARQAEIDKRLQEIAGQQSLEQIGAQGDIQRELAQMDIAAREQFLERQAVLDQKMQELVGTQAMAQIGAQGDIQSRLLAERAVIDQQMQAADAETQKELLGIRGEIDRQLQELTGEQAIEQLDRQGQINAAYQEAQYGFDRNMQNLRGEQANELARINNASSELMQTSQSASMIMANSMQAIGQILSNPDIPATSKEALIGHQMRMLESSLAVTSSIAGSGVRERLQTRQAELEREMQTAIQNNDVEAQELIRGQQEEISRQIQELPPHVDLSDVLDFGQNNTGGNTGGGNQTGGNQQSGGPQDFGYDFPQDSDAGVSWTQTMRGILNNFNGWDNNRYVVGGGIPIPKDPTKQSSIDEAVAAWNGTGEPPEGYAQLTRDGKVRLWHLGEWVYE